MRAKFKRTCKGIDGDCQMQPTRLDERWRRYVWRLRPGCALCFNDTRHDFVAIASIERPRMMSPMPRFSICVMKVAISASTNRDCMHARPLQ